MFGIFKTKGRSKVNTTGGKAVVVIGLYILGLLIHIAINKALNRTMVTDGLVFWTVAGTVIAAVIASIYGSIYAFELNRQKDIDSKMQANLETGRWLLVVLASHIAYMANIAAWLYKETRCDMWELRVKKLLYLQDLMPIKVEELRFLSASGGDRSNFLINFSMHHSAAFDLRTVVGLWNAKKVEADDATKDYFEANLHELPGNDPSDEEKKRLSQLVARELGPKLTAELISLARAILEQSETGITNLIKLYEGLETHLRTEFPEAEFKGLDKTSLEKALGKKLWA